MTDNISTNFSYMGFNALSNSEYAYNVDQVEELTDPKYALGDSISLACTSTKLLRSVNGLKNIDITPNNAGVNLLATITGVAMSPNNTALVVGTNPAGATTLPILYSPNGINFTKTASLDIAGYAPRCAAWYSSSSCFVVGGNATAIGNAVQLVSQTGVNVVPTGTANIMTAIGDVCRCVVTQSSAAPASGTGAVIIGGSLNAGPGNVLLGFGIDNLSANFTAYNDGDIAVGTVGSVNALATDDGQLDHAFVYTLAGGGLNAAAAGNLLLNTHAALSNPGVADPWTALGAAIFPAGATSQVNAIGFNGQYFLVGGLGTVNLVVGTCTVAIATFTASAVTPVVAGTFGLTIPTGCNIATLMTNVRSLEWNGLYWIAGGDNANGFVYARSIDAATWTLIGGAITGATSGLSVSSRFTPQ